MNGFVKKRVVKEVDPNLILHKNDEVVLSGRREFVNLEKKTGSSGSALNAQLLDLPCIVN